MRRNAITSAVQEENDEINLTPMLDVVFIMLIFFIVTANFIKEPGLEINRPDSDTAETQENAAILIAVGPTGEVWMDGRRIDVRQVKANVVKLLADNPQGLVDYLPITLQRLLLLDAHQSFCHPSTLLQ